MDYVAKELGISSKNIFPTASPNLFSAVVHISWLKNWLKNLEVNCSVNNADISLQTDESVSYPWRKVFIRVLSKKVSRVLPLPRYKLNENTSESALTFSQLLQYVSQSNQRSLWKESYKKYCQNNENSKESTIVNLLEYDQLVTEVVLRLYGCNIIRIKTDSAGNHIEYKEMIPNKNLLKSYETHVNLLAALVTLETENNFYVVYRGHYENTLLDCLNFSPNLIDMNYGRGLFIVYQLLNLSKAFSDRGVSIGMLTLQDIYVTENLWLQVLPSMTNNIHCLDESLIYEQSRSKHNTPGISSLSQGKKEDCLRTSCVQLEKLCMLWVRGRISNLDYLLHLNVLAGRSSSDPQAHFMVPWVTDFASRCGRNWRDLTKSKYRLNKGDRQLDMTYDVSSCKDQIPHHVSDALSDITCYVYLARRTPKEVLCKHVRNNWVPAEYPSSIQRMQEWTPDECIPEFYTDPTVFKSMHEDLPDLGVPTWASCAEDFVVKHREALESTHVSENLHHWIDITFGYKLSGAAAVKAKNVCLSLVDGHTNTRRGGAVQLLTAPHPPRASRAMPPAPPRLHWTSPRDSKKSLKNDSSDDITEDEEESTSLPQHVSRLHVPPQRVRSRHKGSSRARSLSKSVDDSHQSHAIEGRASSHSRHYRVQRSEMGKGVIYLPKEFNPVASIQALEALDNFRTKCFLSKAEYKEKHKENLSTLNLYPIQSEIKQRDNTSKDDDTAFTNYMFLASYEQNYLKKISQDAHLENVLKERKNRSFNSRYTTDAAIYKQFVTESRRQDMLVIGCLVVEIFLHTHMRPLRTRSDNFIERFNMCRTVLKYNFNMMPKCVSYIASLLLNVQPPSLSFKTDLTLKKDDPLKKPAVTDKGLPAPTPAQLLQPLLMQHLIPFPQNFSILYNLLSTLHEYELTSNELNILYMYECDGVQCEMYQNVDKTKFFFTQKIAEGKIQACALHLDVLLNQVNYSQFDVLDIFLAHYIELLRNKDTSVLAAWYLFDTVSKALGPARTRNKLLRHILNLYDDDEYIMNKLEHKLTDVDAVTSNGTTTSKQKFAKLYHNIFLLQLMVRLGLQCFLDNFTQYLVEAVGGYKDVNTEVGSPGHLCHNRSMANKKPRYSDDNVKNALTTNNDIFSPDTSYGSEHVATPSIDKTMNDALKDKDTDSRSENEMFHFETDKERLSSRNSRSKSPAESISSFNSSNAPLENNFHSPSPSAELSSPVNSKFHSKELTLATADANFEATPKKALSPTIEIPTKSMFTSYIHFAEEDDKEVVEIRRDNHARQVKSLDIGGNIENHVYKAPRTTEEELDFKDGGSCKISDMSSESLIWLAHRLGPVLTCRYITRNLLKMLTLCYIGKENLNPWESYEKDEFDEISMVNSKVVGDRNAIKVINCLTSIVAMYGEQLIIFQYLPHMSELIASCRKRLSAPLEGGVVACLKLIVYLIPYMSDVKIMEQLQDTFLKSVLQPSLRLASTSRSSYPSGAAARGALTKALAAALHALALRIGPEMTRKHLCTPPLQRFFLAFDKATGKTDNWPKQEDVGSDKISESDQSDGKLEGFLEICRDGTTAEWRVQDGRVVRADLPDLACSPPDRNEQPDNTALTAQEELLMVFDEELAYQTYTTFVRLVGVDAMERSLKNTDTIRSLCRKYEQNHAISSPLQINRDKRFQCSLSDEPLNRRDIPLTKNDIANDHISSSNSFGSNVTLVGNRIDVASDSCETSCQHGFDVVAYKMDNGIKSNRHLRGDWLIYWEHEIGRPDKDNRFNLKQIKLQTFSGHTHSVKSLHCLDNESSFMSGSKDKTVKLWSLRNQGDGNATTQCNWTYTGHKKGVLSLSFLESLRLAVSTDSVVHIWDPFMECVVSQLEHIKAPVSIVRALGDGSAAILAATGDALRVIDARAPHSMYELKVPMSATTFVRCMCVCAGGTWVACGLASGHIAVLELRTGLPVAAWKAHDGEVLRLAAVDEHRLFSSGLDQVTALWKADDGELIAHMKGTTEPVHCLSVYNNELITGTTNNKIGVHTSLGPEASFSSTKLRSDSFKGVLTCMAVLPLNRLLLLASDNGTITLLC